MTAPTVGAFSGLSHAELVAAYQACRARNARLEGALMKISASALLGAKSSYGAMTKKQIGEFASAILAKESTP